MRLPALLSLLCSFSAGLASGPSSEPDVKNQPTRLQVSPYFAPVAGEGEVYELHQAGWRLRFAAGGIDLTSRAGDRLRLRFPGSDQQVAPVPGDQRRGVIHDYRGRDSSKWRFAQPTFGTLRYPRLYPGIDLVYRLEGNRLKSEFLVAAGADPGLIFIEYENATGLEIDEQGVLGITSGQGAIREKAPEVYQDIDGRRRPVKSSYQLEDGRVSFLLEAYDPDYPLTIDPELEFFLFIGGSNGMETAGGIRSDDAGNTFIAGTTFSSDFTTSGSQQGRQGQQDAFVLKLDSQTHQMLYSVLIGGVGIALDTVTGLAVDGAGNAFITGHTFDFSFPTTENAPQPEGAGGLDLFIAKFDPDGQLLLSTFWGGELNEFGGPIALDRGGNVYLAGSTGSTSFPTTPDAFQHQFGGGSSDVVVGKLNNAADTFLFSSYLGGSGGETPSDMALDVAGDVYLAGTTLSPGLGTTGAFQENLANPEGAESDAFVARIGSASGGPAAPLILKGLTYLGGSDSESGLAIALNTLSQVSLSGVTNSSDLPLLDAIQEDPSASGDAFVSVLTPDLGVLLFSTYLGGSGVESLDTIVALADGSFVALGPSNSPDLVTAGADQVVSVAPLAGGNDNSVIAFGFQVAASETGNPEDAEYASGEILFFQTPPDRYFVRPSPLALNTRSTPILGARANVEDPVVIGSSIPTQEVEFVASTIEDFTLGRDVFFAGVDLKLSLPFESPTTVKAPLIGSLSAPGEGALPETHYFSSVAFTNLSISPLTVHLAELGPSLRVSTREIPPGAQLAQLRRQLFGGVALESVWVDLGLSEPSVGSFFQFGTLDLSQLDGGVAQTEPSSEFVWTRAYSGEAALRGQAATTFLSLLNPNPAPVTLVFSLVPQLAVSPEGASPAPVEMTIPTRGVIQKSLAEIFGQDVAGGYVKAEVTQGGGVFAFQVIQPTAQSTVFGLGPQEAGTATTLYSAQLASAPGLFTDLNLINLSDSARQLTLTALDESGTNLIDPILLALGPGEQFSQDAGELFAAPAASPQTTIPQASFVGSLKVEADGPGVVGDVVFGGSDNLGFAAALALQSQTFTEAVFSQVANVPGFFSGLAFFNPGTAPAQFVVEVHAADGSLVGTDSRSLPGGQRLSALVEEFVPSSAGQAGGYIIIRSDVGLIAQMLFGATSPDDGSIRLFSAVPPTVIL